MPRVRENTINRDYAELNEKRRQAVTEIVRNQLKKDQAANMKFESGEYTRLATQWTNVGVEAVREGKARAIARGLAPA